MVARIRLREALDEERQVLVPRLHRDSEVAEDADLPQDEQDRRIGVAAMDEEVRRLVALKPGRGRVDPEVGDEAVERRDGRQHSG